MLNLLLVITQVHPLTMRFPNSYAPMTNGTVLTKAANQICQPTSTGPGTYVEGSTGVMSSAAVDTAVVAAAAVSAAAEPAAVPAREVRIGGHDGSQCLQNLLALRLPCS